MQQKHRELRKGRKNNDVNSVKQKGNEMEWLTDGHIDNFLANHEQSILASGLLVLIFSFVLYVVTLNSTSGVLLKLKQNISFSGVFGKRIDDWMTSRESVIIVIFFVAAILFWGILFFIRA
jgi:hypothetical protein